MLLTEIQVGATYLHRLSRKTVLITRIIQPKGVNQTLSVLGKYYNDITGLVTSISIDDYELLVRNDEYSPKTSTTTTVS